MRAVDGSYARALDGSYTGMCGISADEVLSIFIFHPSSLRHFLLLPSSSHLAIVSGPVKIIRVVESEDEVAVDRRRVALRVVRTHATRQTLDHGRRIWAEEECDRVAIPARVVQHAVRRREVAVVGPALHYVTEVDEKRPLDHGRREPLTARQPNGQTRHVLPREYRDERVVGMRPLAELLVVFRVLRRIVEKAQLDVRLVLEERREVAGRHVERASEHGQHLFAHALEGLE